MKAKGKAQATAKEDDDEEEGNDDQDLMNLLLEEEIEAELLPSKSTTTMESWSAREKTQQEQLLTQQATISRLESHVAKANAYKQLTKTKLKSAAEKLRTYRLQLEQLTGQLVQLQTQQQQNQTKPPQQQPREVQRNPKNMRTTTTQTETTTGHRSVSVVIQTDPVEVRRRVVTRHMQSQTDAIKKPPALNAQTQTMPTTCKRNFRTAATQTKCSAVYTRPAGAAGVHTEKDSVHTNGKAMAHLNQLESLKTQQEQQIQTRSLTQTSHMVAGQVDLPDRSIALDKMYLKRSNTKEVGSQVRQGQMEATKATLEPEKEDSTKTGAITDNQSIHKITTSDVAVHEQTPEISLNDEIAKAIDDELGTFSSSSSGDGSSSSSGSSSDEDDDSNEGDDWGLEELADAVEKSGEQPHEQPAREKEEKEPAREHLQSNQVVDEQQEVSDQADELQGFTSDHANQVNALASLMEEAISSASDPLEVTCVDGAKHLEVPSESTEPFSDPRTTTESLESTMDSTVTDQTPEKSLDDGIAKVIDDELETSSNNSDSSTGTGDEEEDEEEVHGDEEWIPPDEREKRQKEKEHVLKKKHRRHRVLKEQDGNEQQSDEHEGKDHDVEFLQELEKEFGCDSDAKHSAKAWTGAPLDAKSKQNGLNAGEQSEVSSETSRPARETRQDNVTADEQSKTQFAIHDQRIDHASHDLGGITQPSTSAASTQTSSMAQETLTTTKKHSLDDKQEEEEHVKRLKLDHQDTPSVQISRKDQARLARQLVNFQNALRRHENEPPTHNDRYVSRVLRMLMKQAVSLAPAFQVEYLPRFAGRVLHVFRSESLCDDLSVLFSASLNVLEHSRKLFNSDEHRLVPTQVLLIVLTPLLVENRDGACVVGQWMDALRQIFLSVKRQYATMANSAGTRQNVVSSRVVNQQKQLQLVQSLSNATSAIDKPYLSQICALYARLCMIHDQLMDSGDGAALGRVFLLDILFVFPNRTGLALLEIMVSVFPSLLLYGNQAEEVDGEDHESLLMYTIEYAIRVLAMRSTSQEDMRRGMVLLTRIAESSRRPALLRALRASDVDSRSHLHHRMITRLWRTAKQELREPVCNQELFEFTKSLELFGALHDMEVIMELVDLESLSRWLEASGSGPGPGPGSGDPDGFVEPRICVEFLRSVLKGHLWLHPPKTMSTKKLQDRQEFLQRALQVLSRGVESNRSFQVALASARALLELGGDGSSNDQRVTVRRVFDWVMRHDHELLLAQFPSEFLAQLSSEMRLYSREHT